MGIRGWSEGCHRVCAVDTAEAGVGKLTNRAAIVAHAQRCVQSTHLQPRLRRTSPGRVNVLRDKGMFGQHRPCLL